MNSVTKLLIVGASNKSTRSIARSLKKFNVETHVLNDADLAVSKSKYIKEYILKTTIRDINSFKDEILAAVKKYNIQVLLPSTDIAVDVVLHFRGEIGKHVKIIGLNETEVYKFAHNKYELIKLAAEVGLAVPQYIYVNDQSQFLDIDVYPVVVKPVSSARILNGKHFGYKVSVSKTKEELQDTLRELVQATPVMIQQYIGGYGIGYNVYCIDGEVKSEFIHKRLNENEGVSSYRKIIPIDSFGIRQKVHELLKRIKWNGVAMVEFKVDEKGIPYIMEMNGRFFGSTELGVKAGYDLPAFLFTHQYLGKPSITRDTGKFYSLRLLHDEVLLEYANLFKTANITRFIKWKFSLMNLIIPGNFLEDNFFDDPSFVVNLYRYDLKRLRSKRKKNAGINAVAVKAVSKQLFSTSKIIVFVCRGNICRSPFAEYYAKKIFPSKIISSTGTYHLPGRYSPLKAVETAAGFGVDISGHRSNSLDIATIHSVDLFVVMDKLNYYELRELKIPEEKLFFLSGTSIEDPYKKTTFDYEKSYRCIKESLDALINEKDLT